MGSGHAGELDTPGAGCAPGIAEVSTGGGIGGRERLFYTNFIFCQIERDSRALENGEGIFDRTGSTGVGHRQGYNMVPWR